MSGAFVFSDTDPAALQGKERSAFRGGFLGVTSLGWSTLVQIVDASEEDRERLVNDLAQRLVEHFGAPDLAAARAAAEEEVGFTISICNQPQDTLIAVHRSFEDGEIREAFRSLHAKGEPKPLRAFAFLEVEDDEQPADQVDLVQLAHGDRK